MEAIFTAQAARDEKYHAFGKEFSFLDKLTKLGFIIKSGTVYHPEHWEIIEGADKLHTHSHTLKHGNVQLGRVQVINKKR